MSKKNRPLFVNYPVGTEKNTKTTQNVLNLTEIRSDTYQTHGNLEGVLHRTGLYLEGTKSRHTRICAPNIYL